jgi:hypothetical protein
MNQPPLVLKNLGADPERYEREILKHLEQLPIGAIPSGVKLTFHKTQGGTSTVKDIFQPSHKANASTVAENTAVFIVSGRRDLPISTLLKLLSTSSRSCYGQGAGARPANALGRETELSAGGLATLRDSNGSLCHSELRSVVTPWVINGVGLGKEDDYAIDG